MKMYGYGRTVGEKAHWGGSARSVLKGYCRIAHFKKMRKDKWTAIDWAKIKKNIEKKHGQ
jgi:hypothetical protein